ncbi:hypothetical protein JCM16358_04670 [Halanaerocella petrolearia]
MWWIVTILMVVFILLWIGRPKQGSNLNLFDTYSRYLSKYRDVNKKEKRKED